MKNITTRWVGCIIFFKFGREKEVALEAEIERLKSLVPCTQENAHRALNHKEYQQQISIDGSKVWCDKELIPLLIELNKAGLKTRSHCCGHGSNPPWVIIRMGNIVDIEIRKNGVYDELLIKWEPRAAA